MSGLSIVEPLYSCLKLLLKVSFLSAPLGTRLFCWVGLWRLLWCGDRKGMRGPPGLHIPWSGSAVKSAINKPGGFHKGKHPGISTNQSLWVEGLEWWFNVRIAFSRQEKIPALARGMSCSKPAPRQRGSSHLRTCPRPQSRCGLRMLKSHSLTKQHLKVGSRTKAWVCACAKLNTCTPKLTVKVQTAGFPLISSLCQGQTLLSSHFPTIYREIQWMEEGLWKFTRCQPVETRPLWA